MKIFGVLLIVGSLFAGMGCTVGEISNVGGEFNNLQDRGMATMEIALDVGQLSESDVAGILFKVYDDEGNFVDEAYAPLEDQPLPDIILPGFGNHAFADAFFVLLPGTYTIVAWPMQDPETPSEVCQPTSGVATRASSERALCWTGTPTR